MRIPLTSIADMITAHRVFVRGLNVMAFLTGAAALSCSHQPAQADLPAEASLSPLTASSHAAIAPPAPTRAPALVGPVSPKTESVCTDICEHSRRLKCKHADNCRPQCIAMGSFTPCQDQFAAFYRCLATKPDPNWECGEDGVAAIREGFCDSEQESTVTCMEAKMQRP